MLQTKYVFFRQILVLFSVSMLASCADRIATERSAKLRLSVSLAAGQWEDPVPAGGGRFLTPDISTVHIEARSGTAEGELVQGTVFPVGVDGDGIAGASGQLALPVGQPLVLLALIKNADGTIVAQAASGPLTLEAAPSEPPAVTLIILPLANNPDLVDLAIGTNTVSIPAGKSKILRFSTTSKIAYLQWSMATYPEIKYQMRSTEGERQEPFLLPGDTGVRFAYGGTGNQYLLVYNSGATDATGVQFVLEPELALLVAVNASGQAFTSADGIAWFGPFATGLATATSVTYANGLFVAGGTISSTVGVATSTDGETWNTVTWSGTSPVKVSVRPDSAGHFVAAAYWGATVDIYNSDDGLTWTSPTPSGVAGSLVGPAWTNGKWYISGSGFSPLRQSTDGVNWNNTSSSVGMYQANAMVGVNGFVIGGGGAASSAAKQTITYATSTDTFGSTIGVAAATDYIQAFAANPTTFRVIAVGGGTTAQINYSDDYGSTWTTSTGSGANAFRAAAWWKGGFLAGDSAGNVYASTDGASFTLAGSAGTAEIRGIAYNDAP